MAEMLNLYDLNRRKTAVLQNAFDITETHELNKIYSLSFKIPANDEKVKFCQAFHFARYGEGELYRIIKTDLTDSETGVLTVTCEHVIATLVDDLMFGVVQYGGGTIKTGDVINYLLEKQKQANWILSECDFDRKFEYLWEQENLLNALYAIPKEFSKAYKWTFDTHSYPWKLSLKAIDESVHPEYYLRAKRNLLSSGTGQDYADVCTRIYPLGYGEGINQLGIKEINNGIPYLQSPAGIVAQYGIKEKVLVDRRFENAESLKEYAQTMLDALQTPSMSRSFSVVDLYPITGAEIDNAEVGEICRMTGDNTTAYITRVSHVWDQPGNLAIDLSTKATDIASSVADLADRVRIETVYAQGATQLYQHSKDENATPEKGMIMSLYFPEEMKQINKVLLKLKLGRFRSYSQATTTNQETIASTTAQSQAVRSTTEQAQSVQSTTEQAQSVQTTTTASSSVGTTQQNYVETTTTDSNESTGTTDSSSSSISGSVTTGTYRTNRGHMTETNSTGANYGPLEEHYHSFAVDIWIPDGMFDHSHTVDLSSAGAHKHTFSLPSHKHRLSIPSHSHKVTVPSHNHKVTIPKHSHTVTIPKHSHNVTIPSHDHKVTIPAHSHGITAGIFESGNAKQFTVFVNNVQKEVFESTNFDGDITNWLLDSSNQIPRDSWIDIEIRPNDLAYVQCSVFVQGFVQSRGGGNY